MPEKTILIADSGSTKTDWVVLRPESSPVHVQSAGINPFYQTAEEIIPVLQSQLLPYINGAIEEIHFYGAGCANEATSKPVTDALVHCFDKTTQTEVASDMLGAARGLCQHEPGFACILGTGSNNAFYDGKEIVRQIGSLGFWLGDEGSGSYIGKTLVVAYLQNELPPDLHNEFAQTYPEINRLSVLDQAYKKPYPNRFFAGFSTFITSHISHSYVQDLVQNAFRLFLDKYVRKHERAGEYPVHFTGSIAFHYQDLLRNALQSAGLVPGRILKSPLEGLVQYYTR